MKNVRKILMTLLVCALLMGTAWAALTAEPVTYPVMVNGEAMTFTEAGGLPVNVNGRTYLPVRAMAEALGVPIAWKNNRVEIETLDLERLKDSCVMLQVRYIDKQGTQASGVLIDYDEILTCYHAVDEGANTFWATYDDGQKRTLTLTDTAPEIDAAILKPDYVEVKPVKIGDSDEVKVGDKVYVISSPDGSKNIVKTATIFNEDSHVNGYTGFEFSPVTSGGSSGGAVFNAKGELIAIVQSGDNISSFAIPINDIRKALAN